jgi:hypothetical protein
MTANLKSKKDFDEQWQAPVLRILFFKFYG